MKRAHLNLSDYIHVIANVHDLDVDRYFIEVEFRHINGQTAAAILPRGIIKSGSEALKDLLDRGADLPTGQGAGAELASVLSVVPKRKYRITSKIGWHGKSFVLPDVTIGSDADTLLHARRKSANTLEPATKGSLDRWLDGLRDPCRASSYLTFGVGLAFAGPLLHFVGQDEGAIFYLVGESSTGKTLTELAGISAVEAAARDSLLTHDASDRAIEEACTAHNDLLQTIDEISRMTGSQAECRKKVQRLAHKITGGGGSRRSAKARQDADLADLRWRLTCLWSGEHSLGTEFLGAARARGELVRLIEIPIPKREADGVFDRLSSVELTRTELALRAESAVENNFGHAIRAFITRLVKNPDTHARRATELMEKFRQKVQANSDPWTRRFAGKFAVAYAAARLAAELGVAPGARITRSNALPGFIVEPANGSQRQRKRSKICCVDWLRIRRRIASRKSVRATACQSACEKWPGGLEEKLVMEHRFWPFTPISSTTLCTLVNTPPGCEAYWLRVGIRFQERTVAVFDRLR